MKNLGEKITFNLIRLRMWIRRWNFKRALKLRSECLLLVRMGVRIADTNALQIGADPSLDRCIGIAAWRLTSPEYLASSFPDEIKNRSEKLDDLATKYEKEYLENKEKIDELVDLASEKVIVRTWLLNYFVVQSYIERQMDGHESGSRYYFERAREFDEFVEPIDQHGVERLLREARKQIRLAKEILSDREALKIDVSSSVVNSLIGVFSFLFIITGYIFNYFYLGSFGINVHRYFDLSDYVASSIEQIWVIFLGTLYTGIVIFLGMHHASRKPVAQIKQELGRFNWFLVLVITVFLANLIMGIVVGGRSLHFFFSFNILYIGFFVSSYLSDKYFRNTTLATLVFAMLFSYASGMYARTAFAIFDAKSAPISIEACIATSKKSDASTHATECNLRILGSSAGYLFAFDDKTDISYSIRRELIPTFEHEQRWDLVSGTDSLRNWLVTTTKTLLGK